jgi:hypothetical protein
MKGRSKKNWEKWLKPNYLQLNPYFQQFTLGSFHQKRLGENSVKMAETLFLDEVFSKRKGSRQLCVGENL